MSQMLQIIAESFTQGNQPALATTQENPRRHVQLRRILTILGIIGRYRFGLTPSGLHRELTDEAETEFSRRTINRDLAILVDIGLAQRIEFPVDTAVGGSEIRYQIPTKGPTNDLPR